MTVRIPIQADARQVTEAFDKINAAIARAGQAGKAFKDIDLSHPELTKFANDIRKAQQNLDDLQRVARGPTAFAARQVLSANGGQLFGPTGLFGGGLANRYPNVNSAARVTSEAGRYVLNGTSLAPRDPPPPPGSGGRRLGSGQHKKKSRAARFISSVGKGFSKGIGFFAAEAGLEALSKLASESVSQAQREAVATDQFMRHIGDTGASFSDLRDSVMKTANGLALTAEQANRLSQNYQSLTNSQSAAEIAKGVSFAGGFARGYGVDQGAMVQAFGTAKNSGLDEKKLAFEIADATKNGNMAGRTEEVTDALLGYVKNMEARGINDPHYGAGGFADLYSQMNAAGRPSMSQGNAVSLINSINNSFMGGENPAVLALDARAYAKEGVRDTYDIDEIKSGGMFGRPSDYTDDDGKHPYKSDRTNYEIRYDEIEAETSQYKSASQKDAAFKGAFGLQTLQQARNLRKLGKIQFHRTADYLRSIGLDPNDEKQVNPNAINEIAQVIGKDDKGLEEYRDNFLKRNDTYKDKEYFKDLHGDALRASLVTALGSKGMTPTQGSDQQETEAGLANALTGAGRGLLPAIDTMKEAFSGAVGKIGEFSTAMGDVTYALKGPAGPAKDDAIEAYKKDGVAGVVKWLASGHGGGHSDPDSAPGYIPPEKRYGPNQTWDENGNPWKPGADDTFKAPRSAGDGTGADHDPNPGEGPIEAGGPTGAHYTRAQAEGRVRFYARQMGIPEGLAAAVFHAEGSKPGQRSPKGAIGWMQLMPQTAAGRGVNPFDEEDNIRGGVGYLAEMYRKKNRNALAAAASYNAGPRGRGIDRLMASGDTSGLPNETQKYVARIGREIGGGDSFGATSIPAGQGDAADAYRVHIQASYAPLEVRHTNADGSVMRTEYLPSTAHQPARPWGARA